MLGWRQVEVQVLYWILGRPLLWAEQKWKSAAERLFPGASFTPPKWLYGRAAPWVLRTYWVGALLFSLVVTKLAVFDQFNQTAWSVPAGLLTWLFCLDIIHKLDDFRLTWPERHVRYWFYRVKAGPDWSTEFNVAYAEGVDAQEIPTGRRILNVSKHPLWGSRRILHGQFKLSLNPETNRITLTDLSGNTLGPVPLMYLAGLHDGRMVWESMSVTDVVCNVAKMMGGWEYRKLVAAEQAVTFLAQHIRVLTAYLEEGRSNQGDLAVHDWLQQVADQFASQNYQDVPLDRLPRLKRKKAAHTAVTGATPPNV